MPSSQSSAAITAPEPADRASPPQNPPEEKSAGATDPNVGPSKARKPAWNVPSNTTSQDTACSIMGAAAWPALAAAGAGTPPKASPKSTSTASSSSTDDLKSLDGSAVSVPATAKPAPTPEKMVAPAPQQPKPNSTPNLTRRAGTGSENTHNSIPNNNRSSRMVNGSNRRGNNNNNHFHHHNHNNNRGGYRGRDRGGANWNSWNNSRPSHFFWGNQAMAAAPPPSSVSYGYGAAVPSTFIAPVGYEFPYPPMFGHIPVGVPQFFPQMAAPGFYPAGELEHRNSIRKQIEFYFSEENLCRDPWLRRKMDAQGWVPISVIANFNRVKELTDDEHYILEVLSDSTVVEIQGNQIRRRDEWQKWLLPPPTNIGMVENQMQGLAIDHAVVANLEN